MRNPILPLILLFLCFLASPSFAFNKAKAMNFVAVNALMEYGQTLYERGAYDEATAVFNHVLSYDSHQAKALKYLKEMGHAPIEPVKVDVLNTQSLKQAIAAQQQSLALLQSQIKQMRANMDLQSLNEGYAR
jgi:hypothetical protein